MAEAGHSDHPFVAEVTHEHEGASRYVPSCRVSIGPSFRELARQMPVDALRDLVVVMTFATPNGRVSPGAPELGGALGCSGWVARLRLMRLCRGWWRGQPVLRLHRQPSGRETFTPGVLILGLRERMLPPATPPSVAAGRERVISASRARYAKPRAEVERDIMVQAGWGDPAEAEAVRSASTADPSDKLGLWAVRRLVRVGVDHSLAVKLVGECGAVECISQVRWLPYRNAKDKARYLVAAIQGRYGEPVGAPSFPPVSLDADDTAFPGPIRETTDAGD